MAEQLEHVVSTPKWFAASSATMTTSKCGEALRQPKTGFAPSAAMLMKLVRTRCTATGNGDAFLRQGEDKCLSRLPGLNRRSMNLHSEDKDIEPDRASFIRKMVKKWESRMVAGRGRQELITTNGFHRS